MSEAPLKKVDFIVVGGGPVGLLAANLIAQAGLTVRILDIEYEPNHWGRGDWIHGRTLELLETAGLEKELLQTGVKVEKLSSFMNGKLAKEIPFIPQEEHVESKYEYLLCVGQHITESILQSQLSQKDVQVERPSTLISMERDNRDTEYPIKASIMHLQEGKENEEVWCKYVLGCDGAHSDVRHQLNITNEGETTETHAGVIDVLIRTNFASRREVCIVQSDYAKTISLFPRENGLTRIFVHFNENEHEQRIKDQHNRNKIQLEDIQREAKRALLPHRIEFLGVLYWSVYVVGQRAASKMASDDQRVFLCGDAAHSQSPTLGQGVNTGFGDIFNLIWKICMVEKGWLHRKYLSTYHSERRQIAQNVLTIDKMAAKAAAGHQAADYCDVLEKNRLFTSGFGINYLQNTNDELSLFENHDIQKNDRQAESILLPSTTIQPGVRAPNFKIYSYATGRKMRLFDLVNDDKHTSGKHPNWLLFTMFVLTNNLKTSYNAVSKLLNEVRNSAYSTTMLPASRIVLITTSTSDEVAEHKERLDTNRVAIDKLNQAQCHRIMFDTFANGGTTTNTNTDRDYSENIQAILIRPDGYVVMIARASDGCVISEKLFKYFAKLAL